jgi:hypothetical protein
MRCLVLLFGDRASVVCKRHKFARLVTSKLYLLVKTSRP